MSLLFTRVCIYFFFPFKNKKKESDRKPYLSNFFGNICSFCCPDVSEIHVPTHHHLPVFLDFIWVLSLQNPGYLTKWGTGGMSGALARLLAGNLLTTSLEFIHSFRKQGVPTLGQDLDWALGTRWLLDWVQSPCPQNLLSREDVSSEMHDGWLRDLRDCLDILNVHWCQEFCWLKFSHLSNEYHHRTYFIELLREVKEFSLQES